MNFTEESAFLTTFGRELCAALGAIPGGALLEGPCSQHCCTVFADTLGAPPTVQALEGLTHEELVKLSKAFNLYFEVTAVTPEPLERAREAILRHWQP